MNGKHAYDMLMQDLTAQVDQAIQDREEKSVIKAKKMQAKADAQGDLTDTTTTMQADETYLGDLTAACEQKASDFEPRHQLRAEESPLRSLKSDPGFNTLPEWDRPKNGFEGLVGDQPPLGLWDPLGFTRDRDVEKFKRRREIELKYGRVAMFATMGYITPEYCKLPGYLSTSAGLKFVDVPNGRKALSVMPTAGIAQFFAFIGPGIAFSAGQGMDLHRGRQRRRRRCAPGGPTTRRRTARASLRPERHRTVRVDSARVLYKVPFLLAQFGLYLVNQVHLGPCCR